LKGLLDGLFPEFNQVFKNICGMTSLQVLSICPAPKTITGMKLEEFVAKVRKVITQPLCVGFGISTPEQARQVARVADGVIIGSRIIQLMEAEDDLTSIGNFIKELRHALDELSEEEKL
ncbi:unnamed protein product, partial [marine sediment metagenome]